MSKLKSFGGAIILLIGFVLIINGMCLHYPLKADHTMFSYWFNPYKDMSYAAMSGNLKDETILVMGSSEFRHGRKSPYHPRNIFFETDLDLMTIGGPWNQTLFHTIALGALQPKLKSGKAILLVSPTWFKKDGIPEREYAFRFSETEYMRFMENPLISAETKRYVAERSEGLLKYDLQKAAKVRLINHVNLRSSPGSVSSEILRLNRYLADGKDHVNTGLAMRMMKEDEDRDIPKRFLGKKVFSEEDWNGLRTRAVNDSWKKSNNPFDMLDNKWKKKYKKIYRDGGIGIEKKVCSESQEFEDLRAYLEVCGNCGIRTKIVILPLNGRWYDFIGTKKEDRRKTCQKIMQIAGAYGAEATDLSVYDYKEFMTRDAQHPWNAGWVLIDEEIYRFCTK